MLRNIGIRTIHTITLVTPFSLKSRIRRVQNCQVQIIYDDPRLRVDEVGYIAQYGETAGPGCFATYPIQPESISGRVESSLINRTRPDGYPRLDEAPIPRATFYLRSLPIYS